MGMYTRVFLLILALHQAFDILMANIRTSIEPKSHSHDGPEDEIIIWYWVWLGASILLVRLLSDLIVHAARSHLIVYRFGDDDDMYSEKISMAFALFRADSLSILSVQPFHDDTMRVWSRL